MLNRRKSLTEKEVRIVLASFNELRKNGYEENETIGGFSIKEMNDLEKKLKKWYVKDFIPEVDF